MFCENEDTKEKVGIDAHVLALNETHHYFIDPADIPFIARIDGIYLFDRNRHTHCCEWTPSYWLIHLYDRLLLTEAGEALDDGTREELYEKYENCGGEDSSCYVHCHTVEQLIEEAKPFDHYHYGSPEVDLNDVEYDDQMEAIRESCCCNWPI